MKKLFAVLFFFLFAGVAMPIDPDAIPAYVLVWNGGGWEPEDPMVWGAGYPLQAFDTDQLHGDQVPPKWVQFTITDATVAEAQAYCEYWMRYIDWETTPIDPSADYYSIRAFVRPELVSASGLNALTRERVETFLNSWQAQVDSEQRNEVVFSAYVLDVITSNGFWERDVSQFTFTEKSYDVGTGIHEVEFNYQGYDLNVENLAGRIVMRGCMVVKNVPNKITYSCSRTNAFSQFKRSVKERLDGPYSRKKWYFTEDAVNAALANGGNLNLTRQEALSYLHNRLLD